jgi:gliding motility-associated-like protein
MNKIFTNFLLFLVNIIFFFDAYAQSPDKNYLYSQNFSANSKTQLSPQINTKIASIKGNALPTVLAPNIKYQSPQAYVINNPIVPLLPANTGGPVPPGIYGQVSTFAGGGAPITYDGLGTTAGFNLPSGIGADAAGYIYVSDFGSGAIRKISQGAVVHTISHTRNPSALIIDNQGYIYVSDFASNNILKITPAGVVSVFAGSGTAGNTDGTGTAASFNSPGGLVIDNSGNIYVADQGNNSIRMITAAGVVRTVAGGGVAGSNNGTAAAASFNNPNGLTIDKQGNGFIADTKNNLIRKVAPDGTVTTFAGSGAAGKSDGFKTAASFNYPTSITIDASDNLFVADYNNHSIRKITPAGDVTTFAGNGSPGNADGMGTAASFNHPIGLAFDVNGNLFVTDFANYQVRKITLTGYSIDKPLPAGLVFNPQTGAISGTPTAISPATDYTIIAYNAGGSSSTAVNIQVSLTTLKPSIITFPPLGNAVQNLIMLNASSTNTETPLIYTSSNPAAAIITADGHIQMVGVGYSTITVSQPGNGNYSTAAPVSRMLTVYQEEVIAFVAPPVKHLNDGDFSPGATSNVSAFPVTYTSSNPQVATIVNGKIHITGIGTTLITASQAGDALHVAAAPVTQELTVSPLLAFGSIPLKLTCDNDFDPGATSTKSITYVSDNTAVATITNGKIHIIAPGTATITATSNGEVLTQVLTIGAVPQPAISINAAIPAPNCTGTPVLFTALQTDAGTNPTYQWQVNGLDAGTNTATFTSDTLADGDLVSCTITNNSSCAGPVSAKSNVINVGVLSALDPAPTVTISALVNDVYSGTAITLTATTQNAPSGTAYQWKVNGANAGLNQSTFTSTTFKNGDEVTCTITVSNACTLPATSNVLIINILPPLSITIANAFTPNGDGVNDTWSIPNLSYYSDCLVSVFNRYGNKILQSTGYTKPWDGSYGGKPLPPGVYYYIINIKDGNQKLSGNVTILR